MFSKLLISLSVIAFVAIHVKSETEASAKEGTKDCSHTCKFTFRCSPYLKDSIFTIENSKCRVIQNGCFYTLLNCERQNVCLPSLPSITKEECVAHCESDCTGDKDDGKPLCATFAYVNNDGKNELKFLPFKNRCELEKHSCQNGDAYLNEPTPGACPSPNDALIQLGNVEKKVE